MQYCASVKEMKISWSFIIVECLLTGILKLLCNSVSRCRCVKQKMISRGFIVVELLSTHHFSLVNVISRWYNECKDVMTLCHRGISIVTALCCCLIIGYNVAVVSSCFPNLYCRVMSLLGAAFSCCLCYSILYNVWTQ